MTDKQIIIDGVPVQDCCYFDYENDGYEDSCYIHQNECSAQNCYYKQLKRKEQELEELKEKYLELKKQNGSYIVQLNTANEQPDQLKVENEELKMKNSILEDEYKILEDNLDSRTRDFEDVIDGYKQTLTEIKEIAEILAPMTDEYDNCYYKDRCSKCEVKDDCQYIKVEQILQKISECEVDNE